MRIKLLVLVIALQCAWILGMAFTQERSLHTGSLVMLETRPVDPRDLLRGDYITLAYKISDVPFSQFTPVLTNEPPAGTTIYVALAPATNQFYATARASLQRFTPDPGQVLLRGKSRRSWISATEQAIRVDYGLETFYVPEGTGNPTGKLTVQAVAGSGGGARIRQVFLDGVPYREAMKKQPAGR